VTVPEELRQQLIDSVIEFMNQHQVAEGSSRCRCNTPVYDGGTGSMTLMRHRAEQIVDMVVIPAANTITEMLSDKGVRCEDD